MTGLIPTRIEEQIAEVEREITMRQRVYAGQVDRGKMTPDRANRQIEVMVAVLQTLRRCVQLADCIDKAAIGDSIGGPIVIIPETLARKIAGQLRGE